MSQPDPKTTLFTPEDIAEILGDKTLPQERTDTSKMTDAEYDAFLWDLVAKDKCRKAYRNYSKSGR